MHPCLGAVSPGRSAAGRAIPPGPVYRPRSISSGCRSFLPCAQCATPMGWKSPEFPSGRTWHRTPPSIQHDGTIPPASGCWQDFIAVPGIRRGAIRCRVGRPAASPGVPGISFVGRPVHAPAVGCSFIFPEPSAGYLDPRTRRAKDSFLKCCNNHPGHSPGTSSR